MSETEIKQHNEYLLDVIIAALKGYVLIPQDKIVNGNDIDLDDEDGQGTFSYLLGQAIRQWQIPLENWHTSQAAADVWDMIANETIDKNLRERHIVIGNNNQIFEYNESFTCRKEVAGLIIPKFSGTTKQFGFIDLSPLETKELTKKGKEKDVHYAFNNIFIAEHTTPVSDIKAALYVCYTEWLKSEAKRDKDLRAKVEHILNQIHITQMLKIEDRRIVRSNARLKEYFKNDLNKLYNYLVKTQSSEVFNLLRTEYYQRLKYDEKKSAPPQEALDIAEKNIKWAKAIITKEVYDIDIYPYESF